MNLTNDGSKIVDINELIVKYVKKFPFPKETKKEIDLENITYDDIEDSNLLIDQGPMEYKPTSSLNNDHSFVNPVIMGQPNPKSSVVFSCMFRNATSAPQENNLSTTRETKSVTHITISKALIKEGSFALQLQAPNSILQANGGFKKTLTIDKRREYTNEELMSWNAQSRIIVAPHKQIRAELVVEEEDMKFEFKIKTVLSGTLKIYLRNKKTGWRLTHPIEVDDLALVFTKQDGFIKNDNKSVTFIAEGFCHSRFGISQKLNLIEEDLTRD